MYWGSIRAKNITRKVTVVVRTYFLGHIVCDYVKKYEPVEKLWKSRLVMGVTVVAKICNVWNIFIARFDSRSK